jgi:hypothetical protein
MFSVSQISFDDSSQSAKKIENASQRSKYISNHIDLSATETDTAFGPIEQQSAKNHSGIGKRCCRCCREEEVIHKAHVKKNGAAKSKFKPPDSNAETNKT